jgi:hypothetical protein
MLYIYISPLPQLPYPYQQIDIRRSFYEACIPTVGYQFDDMDMGAVAEVKCIYIYIYIYIFRLLYIGSWRDTIIAYVIIMHVARSNNIFRR